MPAISAEGVGRRYGPRWILSPINLEVRCGEAIALFGNNGSGKTTLLRIFATLLAPSTGSVRILGLDLQREKEAIRRHLRFLPHEKQLYPFLTVRENLRLASAVRGIEARDDELALSRLSLKRVADRPIHELSEGMKKRVVLARLLLGDFDVILLDEPHPTLDQEGREVLGELLREWKKSGKTVILASHDHAQALAHADRLVILHEGGVRYDGPPGDAPL